MSERQLTLFDFEQQPAQLNTAMPSVLPELFIKKLRIENGCWTWLGRFQDGYAFYDGKRTDRQLAYILAWMVEYGRKPIGSLTRLCDNPACVKPQHWREPLLSVPQPRPIGDLRYMPIPDYDGYFARSDGTIWSFKWNRSNKSTVGYAPYPVEVSQQTHWDGRKTLKLSKNGVCKRIQVSKLMLFAFVGPCPQGMECCHENGNEGDNVLKNLRWDTHIENMKDAVRHGTIANGESSPLSKYKAEHIIEIRRRYSDGETIAAIAGRFNMSVMNAKAIVTRKTWKHIA